MNVKSLKDVHPIDPDDIWFVCDKCGTTYNDHLEEIIPPKEIKGSIEWAYTPTSFENRWDALEKLKIRDVHENKNKEELEIGDNENLGSCITGDWGYNEHKKR